MLYNAGKGFEEKDIGEMKLLRMLVLAAAVAGCTPTVEVAMPEEPITINLNVRIEHEIRVQVEEDLDALFDEDSGLF